VAFSKHDVREALGGCEFPGSLKDVITKVEGSGTDKRMEIVEALRGLEEPAGGFEYFEDLIEELEDQGKMAWSASG
jgi:hypothetical protein